MTELGGRISIKTIGSEKNRIAFVRDVFEDPDDVISLASTARYAPADRAYPGVRSPVDDNVAGLVKSTVAAAVRTLFPAEFSELSGGTHYSFVTQRPFDSAGMPRRPHFDDTSGTLMAAVLYLSHNAHGGTGFFRHRGTGFETITDDRLSFYDTVVKTEQARFVPSKEFSSGPDHPFYERIGTAQPIFNSMVVYPGGILHSGDIDRIAPILPDVRNGRLTINAFFKPALRNGDCADNTN